MITDEETARGNDAECLMGHAKNAQEATRGKLQPQRAGGESGFFWPKHATLHKGQRGEDDLGANPEKPSGDAQRVFEQCLHPRISIVNAN